MGNATRESLEPTGESTAAAAPREPSSARSHRSRRKRWLFWAAALALGVLLAELVAWASLHLLGHSLESLHATQNDLARGGVHVGSSREAIHPYLGWVLNPHTHPGELLSGRHVPVNALGFLDEDRELPRRSTDRLIVLVLGGSVAWQMTVLGERRFLDTLAARPEVNGREIVLVRGAMAGYKQPQQLMALNYLLSLGSEFDVVVNVDGYNEVALATCENHAAGVFVAYPRQWHFRMADMVDPREYGPTFRLLEARARRQLSARAMTVSPLRWSPTRNLIWLLQWRRCENTIIDIGTELSHRRAGQGRGFHSDGPGQVYQTDDGLFTHTAELWENGSRQLQRLSAANGAAYVHVLQPNQYVPDSKPMGAEEREETFTEHEDFARAVRRGYPLLVTSGGRLRSEGVRFADLTMLFAQIEERIYADPFCHYNQLGNDLLAEAVANLVGDALAERIPGTP